MTLNLEDVSKNPDSLTQEIVLNSGMKVMLRPLDGSDIHLLADFLEQLTPATREYYVLTSYDTTMAKELCNAIGRYNKLRLVVEDISETRIIALFETSFDITDQEMERFQNYGIALDSKTDCRMGPCIADDFQSLGLGSKVFPHLLETAHLFKKKRMILWGGVFANNTKAINFYLKNDFKTVGEFDDKNGQRSIDMIINV